VKILNLTDFNQCPAGALFSLYTPFAFGPPMIKGETSAEPNTVIASHIHDGIQHESAEDAQEKLHGALTYGDTLGMDFDKQYGHTVEPEQMFAVWEANDLMALINRVVPDLPETLFKQKALLYRSRVALAAWQKQHGIISALYIPPGGDFELQAVLEKELET
jgi:hypothetical protein